MLSFKSLIKSQLSLSLKLVDPIDRGFSVKNKSSYIRLKTIGLSFLTGYHAALKDHEVSIDEQLRPVNDIYKGFAYEGAAMSLALRDFIFRGNRFEKFVNDEGKNHIYMSYVGAGWAIARSPHVNYKKFLDKLDPLLKWLVIDGHGFHDGYFSPEKVIHQHFVPAKYCNNYAKRVYTQGVGRSMWFFTGGDPELVSILIKAFPVDRRGDLWSGVGLACAYAGGVSDLVYNELKRNSMEYLPELAQGVAFACKARHLANLATNHTETASSIICGIPSEEAASLTDAALERISSGKEELYDLWRQEIQIIFMQEGGEHGIL